jgi:hypothetical protein
MPIIPDLEKTYPSQRGPGRVGQPISLLVQNSNQIKINTKTACFECRVQIILDLEKMPQVNADRAAASVSKPQPILLAENLN